MKKLLLTLLFLTTPAFAGYGGPVAIIDSTTQVPAAVTNAHELRVVQTAPIPINIPNPLPVSIASPNPLPVNINNPASNYSLESGGHLSTIDGKITTTVNGIKVDGSGVVQPVSATALPLPAGAATATKQDSLLTALGSPFQVGGSIGNSAFGISGLLPAYAATPTFNLGTLNGAATDAELAILNTSLGGINTTLGSPFQAGGSIGNSSFGISGTLPAFAATPTFNLGTLNGAATAANQATEITSLDDINTTLGSPFQAGGSIGNSSFGISGTLPAFAATPTFNLGTLNGAATDAELAILNTSLGTINTTLGLPFQAGGSIGNSAFGISGTLPAFAATPTFNLGTLNGAATAANQATLITALGSPFQVGGSIGNSSFGISGTLPAFAATPTFNLGTLNGAATAANQATEITSLATINTTLGLPFQAGGSIGNSSFGISGTLPAFAATPTFNLGTLNGAATSAKQDSLLTALGSPFQAGGSIGNSSFGISGTLPAFAATPTFNLGTLNGAATAANQATEITSLATINTTLGLPFQAGGSIGNSSFGISGTLPAFAAIPAFKIDQTTPGTTNLVNIGTNGTVQAKAPLNSTGSGSAAAATVSTVITLTAPANAVGAYLMNMDTSTANIRWAVNRTATATLGQQLQPGRSEWVQTAHDISLVAESGTQTYDVQWISQ